MAWKLRLGSMGKPTPGNTVEIIDDNGNPCPAGVVGDIAVHKIHLLYSKNILKIQSEQLCNFAATIM